MDRWLDEFAGRSLVYAPSFLPANPDEGKGNIAGRHVIIYSLPGIPDCGPDDGSNHGANQSLTGR